MLPNLSFLLYAIILLKLYTPCKYLSTCLLLMSLTNNMFTLNSGMIVNVYEAGHNMAAL